MEKNIKDLLCEIQQLLANTNDVVVYSMFEQGCDINTSFCWIWEQLYKVYWDLYYPCSILGFIKLFQQIS